MPFETIHVATGRPYDILLGDGLLDRAGEFTAALFPPCRAAVVTDDTVAGLYGARVVQSLAAAGFLPSLFAFPAGEPSKNHRTLLDIYAYLAENSITRSDLIVALGGGVPGDVAGFAAATWQRGVDFIQIPTTLLAQVDSSIGGKTAVDLPAGKNLVGAFWQPRRVLCDPQTLRTLDARNTACGMAEIIKHACIRSAGLFETLENASGTVTSAVIRDNLCIKRDIVERDERESGERMLLNFGHTLGHAVEKLHHYQGVTHGEAVAAGMALMARAGERNGVTAPGTGDRLCRLLVRYGLPAGCELPLREIAKAAENDKKRAGGDIRVVLLRSIGEGMIRRMPVSSLAGFLGAVSSEGRTA